MEWYNWIIENKESLKIIYALVIALICTVIVIKTHKLFKLSFYQGIRYFRNAFFFYGIAFIIRYIFGSPYLLNHLSVFYFFLTRILFEFFLVMAGFFIIYSLLWKKFESYRYKPITSLFNSKIIIFYILTIVIVILDFLWETYYFMFFSQIILFSYAFVISYFNYERKGKRHKFLKFYFIAMLLSLIGWILNFVLAVYLEWNKGILIGVYGINIIIFLLFLYGVIKVTKKTNVF